MNKIIEVTENITPRLMIDEGQYYDIVSIDPKYIIKKHKIVVKNGLIEKVYIDGIHPNANRDTNELCLPDEIKGTPYDEMCGICIKFQLSQYNLDHCYFEPEYALMKFKKKHNLYRMDVNKKTISPF